MRSKNRILLIHIQHRVMISIYTKQSPHPSATARSRTRTCPLYEAVGQFYNFALNWSSVTPLPMAAVDDTPPVTVFMRLSM